MKINQLDVRWDEEHFGKIIRRKWGITSQLMSKGAPVIVFGCYSSLLKSNIMNQTGLVVIVWSGGDSLRLHERTDFVDYCKKNEHRIFHFAHSHCIQKDLDHWGIKYIDKVILPQDLEQFQFDPNPGRSIYHYTTTDRHREWFYGTDIIKPLRDRWVNVKRFPDNVYIAKLNAYRGQQLIDVYRDSSIGVRLTEHDNMALSCIELGLMGRRSIFNGNIPGAIPYPTLEYRYDPLMKTEPIFRVPDLSERIGEMLLEHWHDEPSKELAEEMREFVHDDYKWLDTKYYE